MAQQQSTCLSPPELWAQSPEMQGENEGKVSLLHSTAVANGADNRHRHVKEEP